MTNKASTIITADEFCEELRRQSSPTLMLLMPVGALTRRLPIHALEVHASNVELRASQDEVLSFSTANLVEIRRSIDIEGNREFTRYELTFPSGHYLALIVGAA